MIKYILVIEEVIIINEYNDLSKKWAHLLFVFEQLNKGSVINKQQIADKFGVSPKSIQRDIRDLRTYFSQVYLYEDIEIVYDRKKNGHVLIRDDKWLTQEEILSISKVLLESRGFCRIEMNQLLDKLILQSVPEERKHIKDVIRNERFHYNPVKHNQPLFRRIWDLSKAVRQKKVINMNYERAGKDKFVERKVNPVGIIFAEYYFYLIAYIADFNYDFPTVYRLDRIQDYQIQDKKFKIPYTDRFKEGEFRKRVQFMQPGKLMKIKFNFSGWSLEAILDRLPTAKVIDKINNVYTIEAEVYGRGIKMWLLSQGEYLEVLEPTSLREEMKGTIKKMKQKYK